MSYTAVSTMNSYAGIAAMFSAVAFVTIQSASAEPVVMTNEVSVGQIYQWDRPDAVGRPVPRTQDPIVPSVSSFQTTIERKSPNTVELSENCPNTYQNNLKPPFIYERPSISYEETMVLIGHAAGHPVLDPVASAPSIAKVLTAPEAVFQLKQANSDQYYAVFFSGQKVVCFSYIAPERDFAFGLFSYALMKPNSGQQSEPSPMDQFTYACPANPDPDMRRRFAKICGYSNESEETNVTNLDNPPSPENPNLRPPENGDQGGGLGNENVQSSDQDLIARINALLARGAERTPEIELLLCAIDHPECSLSLSASDILLLLQLSSIEVAGQRLEVLLSA